MPKETSVSLTSADGTSLNGTLALPQSSTPATGLPAVLMVNDVSAADRDHPYAPLIRAPLYQHLAAHLAHAGFASLRTDPRDKTKVSLAKLVQDAKAAYTALASTAEVDKSKVFVLSHGTSSIVALSLLKEGLTAKGYVALAPAIQKLDEVLLYKGTQPYKAAKCGKWFMNSVEKRYNNILKEIADGTYQEEELLRVPVSLWKDWLAFDGAATLGGFAGPVLVLRGDQDIEMPAEQVTAAEDAAKAAGKTNLTAQTLSGITFSFAEGAMDDLWEAALLPLDLPQAAIDPLLNWLKANK
jgi:dienelactone hydrolase